MITLTVTSLNGAASSAALSASFDELGGTIGRADTNQLVLPDPDRAISRVHAQVVYRGGTYAVVDRGSNPILVNGQPVGSGREMPIRAGDRVQIGGFVLEVREPARAAARAPAASDDPFADLLGPAVGGPVDPLAAFGLGEASPSPAGAAAGRAPAASPVVPAASPASGGGIPVDWDPFAASAASARPPAQDFAQSLGRPGGAGSFGLDGGAAAPAALVPDLPLGGPGNDNSLDALFGLKPGTGGGDPLANSVLDAPIAGPNMAASHDPMKSLGTATAASAQTVADDFSDLHRPFIAPPAVDRVAAAATPSPAPVAAIPASAVLSWEAPEAEGRTVIGPAMGAGPVSPVTEPVAAPVAIPEPAVQAAPVGVTPPAAPAAPSAPAAGTAALLEAFREGLGVPGLKVDQLTPDLMRLIGQLLHESARGTVDLLVARSALKREVRAEATMIVAQKNNPLKFSPSAEVALQHLLSPTMRGFMDPAPAMRDAYDDLRAHQFGFIAGMRAALGGVLERFKPSELEGRLTQRPGLRSLLPGSRKAAMWEVFTEHYAQISTEAEDDFHSLFGKAFLQAYEQHIAQLQRDADQ